MAPGGEGVEAHEGGADGIGFDHAESGDEEAGGDGADAAVPGAFAAGHGGDAVDDGEVEGAGGAEVDDDARDTPFVVFGAGGGFFLGGAGGGLAAAGVEDHAAAAGGLGGGFVFAGVVTVDGDGGDAEEVFHTQGDAAGGVFLEFGDGDHDVALVVGVVEVEGVVEEAGGGGAEAVVAAGGSGDVGVLHLDAGTGVEEGGGVPAGVVHELFEGVAGAPGAFEEADAAGSGVAKEADEGADDGGVGVLGAFGGDGAHSLAG